LKQVLVFAKGVEAIEYKDWHQPVEVILGVTINIGMYLREEGIE
jgi:hypothetical protein